MDILHALLEQVIHKARIGEYASCASLWNKVISHLEHALAQKEAVPIGLINKLQDLLTAQEHSDWVRFADILEFEI
jgi:hypothetical protein